MSWQPVNTFLLLMSLLFYAWGEGYGLFWLILSVVVNDVLAHLIAARKEQVSRKLLLASAIVLNLAFLCWFKYAGFLAESINFLTKIGMPVPHVALPLGISFYTFQSMSYVIDVYRRNAEASPSPVNFACYVTMFPQLVAGPIVRYTDVAENLVTRYLNIPLAASGLRRFLAGLVKKVLIANSVAPMADAVWRLAEEGKYMHPELVALGIICYALQIYYDFSGYSDMAIGLGRMFGFHFPENFKHPYCASSIREFWRRWHISLSSWFKDYLYIPLGGSRCSKLRAGINGLIVFGLCGLWHGASVMFVLWGLWHGLFLMLERWMPKRKVATPGSALSESLVYLAGHLYTIVVFLIGWILFRSESWLAIKTIFVSLFAIEAPVREARALWLDCTPLLSYALIIGFIFVYPVVPFARCILNKYLSETLILGVGNITLIIMGFVAFLFLTGGSYNPFLYFRF